MLWNVILVPVNKDPNLYGYRLTGYDQRPLRFTEKKYADRLAHEYTNLHSEVLEKTNMQYLVVDETNE